MTERQIFGYTPPTPTSGQVGYIVVHYMPDHSNHWPCDAVRVTMRPPSETQGEAAVFTLPRDYAVELADMILTNAHPALPASGEVAQFFSWEHLPPHLRETSRMFGVLAQRITMLPANPERSAAIRHLLEAKDCAVRAVLWKASEETAGLIAR